MAKVRQARKCRARRTDGHPCQGWAIVGATVCRAHGGAAPQVQRAAYYANFEQWAYRVFEHEMQRQHRARVEWMARRIAVVSSLLGVPVEQVTEAHIWECIILHGEPRYSEPVMPPRDRRYRAPEPPRRSRARG